jgi:predicted 2-oxoglutarate/Fe(II)-dependent dioxygenase YbiX
MKGSTHQSYCERENVMSTTRRYFEENGYVVLSGALSKEKCNLLTERMFSLVEQGKTQKDEQCPLSDGIYSDPELDKLLEEFCTPIGQNIGKKLLPTYTYARVYRPGEVLKKHVDRPSCEISATLTLGYDAKRVWPIMFDKDKHVPVDLEVGELAVYKGCDVVHWRDAFKGNWHVQVFLHYVDADGPHADHIFDKRQGLSHHTNTNVVEPRTPDLLIQEEQKPKSSSVSIKKAIFNSVIIPSKDADFPGYININSRVWPELMFTPQECDRIIQLVRDAYPVTSSVGGTKESSKIDRSIRSADIYNLENDEENKWIYDKVTNAVSVANAMHFDYDISGITHSIQLIHYKADAEVPGHYDWHVDAGRGEPATRKISFTAQLSDPRDYEGCELLVNDHGNIIEAPKERGSINMFPSYQVHKVCPITRGERFALVLWIHGSRRFK